MAVAFVQVVATGVSASALTQVITVTATTTTVGNLVTVAARGAGGCHIASVADSRGNTWQVDVTPASVTSTASIASCIVAAGKVLVSGDTITVTFSTALNHEVAVDEFSGVAASGGQPVVDQTNNTHNTAAGAVTAATTVNSQAGDLALSCVGDSLNADTYTLTTADPSSGGTWVAITTTTGVAAAYQLGVASASLYSCTWTPVGASTNSDASVVTYKAAAVAWSPPRSGQAAPQSQAPWQQRLQQGLPASPFLLENELLGGADSARHYATSATNAARWWVPPQPPRISPPGLLRLTASSLTSGGSTTDANTFNTASITPAPNSLLTLYVVQALTGGATVTSVTGLGLTWTQQKTLAISSSTRIDCWTAPCGASPGSGAITINLSGVVGSIVWDVDQFTHPAGVPQVVAANVPTAGPVTGTAASVTYAAAADPGNLFSYGCGAAGGVTQTPAETLPWTETGDQSQATPSCSLQTQVSADVTVLTGASTLSVSVAWGVIGIEIGQPSSGAALDPALNAAADRQARSMLAATTPRWWMPQQRSAVTPAIPPLYGRGATTGGTGTSTVLTSYTIPNPSWNPATSTSYPGDVCLLWVTLRGATVLNVPAGFTAVTASVLSSSQYQLFYRVTDGSEGATFTISWASGGNTSQAVANSYPGMDTVAILDPVPSASGIAGLAGASITTTHDGDILVWLAASKTASAGQTPGLFTPPAGFYTEIAQQSTVTAANPNVTAFLADMQQASRGATGTLTGTSSSATESDAVLVVALSPAPVLSRPFQTAEHLPPRPASPQQRPLVSDPNLLVPATNAWDPTINGVAVPAQARIAAYWDRRLVPQQPARLADPLLITTALLENELLGGADTARHGAAALITDRREAPQQRPYFDPTLLTPSAPPFDPTQAGRTGRDLSAYVDRREVPQQHSYVSDPSMLTTALLENELLGQGDTARHFMWFTDRRLVPQQLSSHLPPPAGGQWILAQQVTGSTAAALNTPQITINTAGGCVLVALFERSGGVGTGAMTSVTDSAGNTWLHAASGALSGVGNTRIEAWYTLNPAPVVWVQGNSATSQVYSWNIQEWQGATSVALDAVSATYSGIAAGNPTIDTPAISTSGGTDLVVAAIAAPAAAGSTSLNSAGWSSLSNFDQGTNLARAAYNGGTGNAGAPAGSYSAEWIETGSPGTGTLTISFSGSLAPAVPFDPTLAGWAWKSSTAALFADRRLMPQQPARLADPLLITTALLENELLGGADTSRHAMWFTDRRLVPQQRFYISDPLLLSSALLENELLGGAETGKRYGLAGTHSPRWWMPQQPQRLADPLLIGTALLEPPLLGQADSYHHVQAGIYTDRRLVPQQRPYISDPSFYPSGAVTDPLTLAWGAGGTYWLLYNQPALLTDRREVPQQRTYNSDPLLLTTALLEGVLLGGADTVRHLAAAYYDRREVPQQRPYVSDPSLLLTALLENELLGGAGTWLRYSMAGWLTDRREAPQQRPCVSDPGLLSPGTDPLTLAAGVGGDMWRRASIAAYGDRRMVPLQRASLSMPDPVIPLDPVLAAYADLARRYGLPFTHADRRLYPQQRLYFPVPPPPPPLVPGTGTITVTDVNEGLSTVTDLREGSAALTQPSAGTMRAAADPDEGAAAVSDPREGSAGAR